MAVATPSSAFSPNHRDRQRMRTCCLQLPHSPEHDQLICNSLVVIISHYHYEFPKLQPHIHRRSSCPKQRPDGRAVFLMERLPPREVVMRPLNRAAARAFCGSPSHCGVQGFRSVYAPRREGCTTFAELLDRVADVNPEMRVRFTSPHPKDFSDDVLVVSPQRP